MKTVLYHVATDDAKWKDVVVEDFRWICTSGLFTKCDRICIGLHDSSAKEWVKIFWGRIDDTKKVEIHINENPEDEIVYVNTNLSRQFKTTDME